MSAFLTLLQRDLTKDLTAEQRDRLGPRHGRARRRPGCSSSRAQVALARLLPDYWQRFDAVRAQYLGDAASERGAAAAEVDESGREGRGLLARLFGRG